MSNIIWKVKPFEELTISELYDILKARVDVFVVEQNCPYPDLDGYDQKAVHLWAEQNGKILAYCRIFDKGIKYDEASIGRVLTTVEARQKKLGKQMMSFAIEVVKNNLRRKEVRISAQDYLLKFYSEFGFQDTGKKYLEDDIPHTEMYLLVR